MPFISISGRKPTLFVLVSIVIAIAFIENDGWPRYQRIITSTEYSTEFGPPAFDDDSPTGYELGLRRLILPQIGLDGLQWIIHTQRLVADGGWRIRYTDGDNVPEGREIHWSHGFIWWLIGCGKVHSAITQFPLPASIEAVAPVASTLLLVIFIATAPWLIFRFLGALAAGAFAIGLSGNYGMVEYFMVGSVDHHGFAAVGLLTCSLMLAVGGAGWVVHDKGSNPKQRSPREKDAIDSEYKISLVYAKAFFVGSATMGAVAMWVSAATAIPTLLGIVVGAGFLILRYAGRKSSNELRYEPKLWFWWGLSGCCGSLFFYLLEYFPTLSQVRLEVNHPLYGFAWLGCGVLLSQAARWRVCGATPWRSKWSCGSTVASVVAMFLPLVFIWADAPRYFWISDRFLWTLHADYISEFQSIVAWSAERSSWLPLFRVGLCPLLSAFLALRFVMRSDLKASWKCMLGLVVAPAVMISGLGLLQVRWLGIANTLWLPLVPIFLAIIQNGNSWSHFRSLERRVGGAIVAALLFLLPGMTLWENLKGIGAPSSFGIDEGTALYVRDLAYSLRRSNVDKEIVVLSGPMSTNYMMYYGGTKGIGTLYWENLAGLKSAARIYAARTESEALQLIQRHRVSHLAIFSFEPFDSEYIRLIRDLPRVAQPSDAFIPALIASPTSVSWMTPLPIKAPAREIAAWALLMEVRPMQTLSQARIGAARFYESHAEYEKASAELRQVVDEEPDNRDAWFLLGVQWLYQNESERAQEAIEKGLAKRTATEAAQMCVDAAMNCYRSFRHLEAVYLLRHSLSLSPNQPTATNLLAWLLATSFDESVRNPKEALELAHSNSAFQDSVSYLDTLAAAQAANGQFSDSVSTMERAVHEFTQRTNGDNNQTRQLEELVKHLNLYRDGNSYRPQAPK